jgi:hypothetical protein
VSGRIEGGKKIMSGIGATWGVKIVEGEGKLFEVEFKTQKGVGVED